MAHELWQDQRDAIILLSALGVRDFIATLRDAPRTEGLATVHDLGTQRSTSSEPAVEVLYHTAA